MAHVIAVVLGCLVLASGAWLPRHAVADGPPEPAIARQLWSEGFPPSGPLDVEWQETTEYRGVTLRRLRYNGGLWDGEPIRIFALYGEPEGPGPHPAILQIHGGGQTAYPINVAWFVEHGYACLAFDWSGLREGRKPEDVTVWPERVQGSHFGREGYDGLVYHAVAAAVRGIDVLREQPGVDPDRIGVQGISWGGLIVWLVNGLDARVKAAVATYGSGGFEGHWSHFAWSLLEDDAVRRRFIRENLEPLAFARMQHGPLMFLCGTNDFFGQLTAAEGLLARLEIDARRAYSPNHMHTLEPDAVHAGMAWLDRHVRREGAFPAEPELELVVDEEDGVPIARVRADASRAIRSVRVDFSRGWHHPLLRCWLPAAAERIGEGRYAARLPIVDAQQELFAVAQVTYAGAERRGRRPHTGGDYTISSAVAWVRPAVDLRGVKATELTTDTLSGWGHGTGGWLTGAGVDFPPIAERAGRLVAGEVGGRAAVIFDTPEDPARVHMATRLPTDAARNKGNRRGLELWTHDLTDVRMRINHYLREPDAMQYQAEFAGGGGWCRTVLRLGDFLEFDEGRDAVVEDPASPFSWNDVHQFSFHATGAAGGTPAIGLMRWIDHE